MKLTDIIKKYFTRKHSVPLSAGEMFPLRIEGVRPAPLTDTPDDAELAAQALLESMSGPNPDSPRGGEKEASPSGDERGASYYHALADRIRTAHAAETRLAMRLLAAIEERLQHPQRHMGQWTDMERKLYRVMDIAEREGDNLKRRWQHCLANVIVMRMEEEQEVQEENK